MKFFKNLFFIFFSKIVNYVLKFQAQKISKIFLLYQKLSKFMTLGNKNGVPLCVPL